ncbi:glycoside hydrolase family 9 protein [Rubrivirga marina]|uniref:Glycoside hydrolase n=1 Tax=Rubrivirga marina TaxID=1196024 RepID=A0A271IWV5_9BACT|nr:glycoside hydrolase family 9 protein [Rubrivirga marina]PAP75029.1 glycoside hydrolase [Rubrivirga marina]
MTARLLLLWGLAAAVTAQDAPLQIHDREYFDSESVDVLVYNNRYSGLFSDSKLSGVELIHHGVRTGTNGDVRLSNAPEQWDPTPEFGERAVDREAGVISATSAYPDYDFEYEVETEARPEGGVTIRVVLSEPVPEALEGRAGFNLEFLPSAYFGKAYLADGRPGQFPRSPVGPMAWDEWMGRYEPQPLAEGATLVLAPEDAERRVTIEAHDGATLALYDGRNRAQNGWFVVRSLLPAGETGTVLEWTLTPSRTPGWQRAPVIGHSQVGYAPGQPKSAVIELDPAADPAPVVTLTRIEADGTTTEAKRAAAEPWGGFLRYQYATFDFSDVTEPGVYTLSTGSETTEPFRIADDVYGPSLWSATLDTFMPVQMDHMFVNDRYRVWHGASHLDDALQAPVNHEHFDLFAQGPTTDTPYEPGEHIPGLAVGGWYDAGDYDIRTQSQYATVSDLVLLHETFGVDWDETTVKQDDRYVEMRTPDGIPDVLQQVEHGVLQLQAQYDAVGHAIPGIVEAHLHQYHHLGDGLTKTDNRVYDPTLDSLEVRGDRSGTFDDRWAFTSKSTALDYGSIAALAAASRVLRGYRDDLAEKALQTAIRVWDEEHARLEPILFRHGNTTGGFLPAEELGAAVELLLATEGDATYADRIAEMVGEMEGRMFGFAAPLFVRAMPHMDDGFRERVREGVAEYADGLAEVEAENPYGVPVGMGGWGGAGGALQFAMTNHILHRAFPDLVGPEPALRGVEYVLGRHPGSDVSMISGIGARSKTVAYGMNRADYSFIPGGPVPGLVVVQPDFPELQEDWPFLWYEGEYVIPMAPLFLYAALAADDLTRTAR